MECAACTILAFAYKTHGGNLHSICIQMLCELASGKCCWCVLSLGGCWTRSVCVQRCQQTHGAWAADRQRTLRELVVGKTLVCQDGRWLIRHGASDYKTGRSYGERPPLVVAGSIYPEVRALAVATEMTKRAISVLSCLVAYVCLI